MDFFTPFSLTCFSLTTVNSIGGRQGKKGGGLCYSVKLLSASGLYIMLSIPRTPWLVVMNRSRTTTIGSFFLNRSFWWTSGTELHLWKSGSFDSLVCLLLRLFRWPFFCCSRRFKLQINYTQKKYLKIVIPHRKNNRLWWYSFCSTPHFFAVLFNLFLHFFCRTSNHLVRWNVFEVICHDLTWCQATF